MGHNANTPWLVPMYPARYESTLQLAIDGLFEVALPAYHPAMNATLELTAILMLLMAGCDEPRATTPQMPPAATVEVETTDLASEPQTTPESVTEAPAKPGEITGKVICIFAGIRQNFTRGK